MPSDTAKLVRILLYVTIPFLVAVLAFSFLSSLLFEPYQADNKSSTMVEIGEQLSFKEICEVLEDRGILRSSRSLCIYARLKGTPERVTAGEYVLSPSNTPAQILQILVAGKTFKRPVQIPEGISVWRIGPILEEAGLISATEFEKQLTNPDLLVRAGISSNSFEGYFASGLYELARPITADKIIWEMVRRAEQEWPEDFSRVADELRLSRHEVLTLASIIERTTPDSGLRLIVSSVLHNRLKFSMKLESAPTVLYGIQQYDQGSYTLSPEDLSSPSPYNTYIHLGLPPGPICTPSTDSIRAALFPSQSNFLFFVEFDNGMLEFAETMSEYNLLLQKKAVSDLSAQDPLANLPQIQEPPLVVDQIPE